MVSHGYLYIPLFFVCISENISFPEASECTLCWAGKVCDRQGIKSTDKEWLLPNYCQKLTKQNFITLQNTT